MKKKILYVITKSNWGGAQRYVFDLATAMKGRGYEIVVALGGEGVLKQKLESTGIRTLSISSLGRDISAAKDAASFKTLYKIIKTERPDILHLNSPKAAGLGALAGNILGIKKIIYTVHGWTFNESRPFWQKALIALFSWFTMLLCDKVILLSEKEHSQTLSFPFIKNKLMLISLGVQATSLLSKTDARTRLHLDQHTLVIGTIAELHPNKGLPYLIEALSEVIKKYPAIESAVISDGQERKNLESQTLRLGLRKHVLFSGYVENAAQLMKAFDIFALPSLKEGFPYVLLEAGQAELPVIASNVGGIPDIVENGTSGILVSPKNPQEIRRALEKYIENPNLRKEHGQALKNKVEKKFSFEKMLSETEKLYTL